VAMAHLRSLLEPYLGKVARLTGDTVIAHFESASTPTDGATRAVRFAAVAAAKFPGGRFGVGTRRGVVSSNRPIGEVVDRNARLLDVPDHGVCLDVPTAELLDTRFRLDRRPWGFLLLGEHEIDEAPRALLGQRTAFVGRSREMQHLDSAVEECVEE